jgi:micrococcal nuclease
MLYEYSARITRVIDGDTVVADVDLGFSVQIRETFRLYGINAPEIRGRDLTPADRKKGKESTEHLEHLIKLHSPICMHTIRDRRGKYGRYLAILYGKDMDGIRLDLNQQMVEDGQAVKGVKE